MSNIEQMYLTRDHQGTDDRLLGYWRYIVRPMILLLHVKS